MEFVLKSLAFDAQKFQREWHIWRVSWIQPYLSYADYTVLSFQVLNLMLKQFYKQSLIRFLLVVS